MIKTKNTFSNYAPGYAASQLVKLRKLRHRQIQDDREAALARMTFDHYVRNRKVM
jgi:hypothetical protein